MPERSRSLRHPAIDAVLTPAIAGFRAKHPLAEIVVEDHNARDYRTLLLDDTADVVLSVRLVVPFVTEVLAMHRAAQVREKTERRAARTKDDSTQG